MGTVIYYGRIERMFSKTGQVGRYAGRAQRAMVVQATKDAPVGRDSDPRTGRVPGRLKAGHRASGLLKRGYACDVAVRNVADHANFVHEGTRAIITPRAGGKLVLPGRSTAHFFGVDSVRGQHGNPWLSNAMIKVLSRRGLLR